MGPTGGAAFERYLSERVDVQFMQTPDNWPQWPYLPLVQRGTGQAGLLMERYFGEPIQPIVYLSNLYRLPANLSTLRTKEYPTFEALQADGWRID